MEKKQGILLSAFSYLGRQKILKVFTKEEGLISLIVKSPRLASLSSPFCVAEWVYKKSQKELFSLHDGTLQEGLLSLRNSYEILASAGAIASDLLSSQLPCKPTPLLYELLFAYFGKLGASTNPRALTTSFRLKLLIHDGLLSLHPHCSICNDPACALREGESFCFQHGGEIVFTSEEWDTLLLLAYSRKFTLLEQGRVSEALWEKTSHLFQERVV